MHELFSQKYRLLQKSLNDSDSCVTMYPVYVCERILNLNDLIWRYVYEYCSIVRRSEQ